MFNDYYTRIEQTQDNSTHIQQNIKIDVDATRPITIDINPDANILRFDIDSAMGKGILESALDPYCKEPHITLPVYKKDKSEQYGNYACEFSTYRTEIFLDIPIRMEKLTICGKKAIAQYQLVMERLVPVQRFSRLKRYSDEIDHVISEGTDFYCSQEEMMEILKKLKEVSGSRKIPDDNQLREHISSFHQRLSIE